jgi:hypothetical protein
VLHSERSHVDPRLTSHVSVVTGTGPSYSVSVCDIQQQNTDCIEKTGLLNGFSLTPAIRDKHLHRLMLKWIVGFY